MDKLAFQVDGKYIDAATNKTVSNPSGYEIIEWPEEIEFPSKKDLIDLDLGLLEYYDISYKDSGKDIDPYANPIEKRSAVNNFGYEDKPFLVEAANFIPGQIGLAGKAINVAMNINNKTAIDGARDMLGLEPTGKMENVFKDRKGFIADVDINNEDYSVGFEALDNKKRTTLTPEEARKRSLISGGMTELSKAESKQALKDFRQDKKAGPTPVDSAKVAPESFAGAGIGTGAGASGTFDLSRNVFGAELNPEDDRGEVMARGMGLMDVSPSFRQAKAQGVNYKHEATRGPVTTGLTDRSVEAMNALAGMQPDGINVTSAYRSPSLNKAIGGAKQSLHSQGSAFDISTKGLTDSEKRDLVERSIMSGAEEIGTYNDQSLHIGTKGRFDPLPGQDTGGVAAMFDRSRYNLDSAPDWFKEGVSSQSRLAPIPVSRPMPSSVIAEVPENPQKDPFEAVLGRTTPTVMSDTTGFTNSFSEVARAPTIASDTTGFSQRGYPTVSSDTTGFNRQVAGAPTIASDSTGFMSQTVNPGWSGVDRASLNITDDDRRLSAMTLAGEIDLSKTDLTTEEGRREAFGIMSTIENRAPKYGGISSAITAPKQYSTWNNSAASNTATKNYMSNSKMYDDLVNDYFNDPKSNLGFTSYHANFVNPGWSSKMGNVTDIGPHKFGTLPEYTQQQRSSFIPDNPPVPQEKPTFKTQATTAPSASSGFMNTGGANRPASQEPKEIESRAERERKSVETQSKSTSESRSSSGGGNEGGSSRTPTSQSGSGSKSSKSSKDSKSGPR